MDKLVNTAKKHYQNIIYLVQRNGLDSFVEWELDLFDSWKLQGIFLGLELINSNQSIVIIDSEKILIQTQRQNTVLLLDPLLLNPL